jgi:hypothetical protein
MARNAGRGNALGGLVPLALMPAAAFVVHQLRYWLAFGSRVGLALDRQGHRYLHSVVPWIVLALAVAAGGFLRALGRALGGSCSLPRRTLSFGVLWLVCACALLAIYVTQESLEGVLASGHPTGLAAIIGYGGWWALPASVAVGLVLAALFHGARWVLLEVAERCQQSRPKRIPLLACARLPAGLFLPRLAPLADGRAGRAPPAAGGR